MSKRLRHKIPKEYIEGRTVFDAGTGVKSIEFLRDYNPKKIIAVSISENEIQEIKGQGLDKDFDIKLQIRDITDENFKLDEKVDVIFAGYFFSALEGTRPFQTLQTIEKLKSFLHKDGIIIIEDFYWEEQLKEPQDILCKKLWNLKDGLKTILGVQFPKQMSSKYVRMLLNLAGFKVVIEERESEDRERYQAKLEKYREQVESVKKYINQFSNQELKNGLTHYVDDLIREVEKIGKPAYFAHDFLIIAGINR